MNTVANDDQFWSENDIANIDLAVDANDAGMASYICEVAVESLCFLSKCLLAIEDDKQFESGSIAVQTLIGCAKKIIRRELGDDNNERNEMALQMLDNIYAMIIKARHSDPTEYENNAQLLKFHISRDELKNFVERTQ